jgi:hypothetical protein
MLKNYNIADITCSQCVLVVFFMIHFNYLEINPLFVVHRKERYLNN